MTPASGPAVPPLAGPPELTRSSQPPGVLLDAVRAKLGGVGAARAVGLSRAALYRYLSGERAVPARFPRTSRGIPRGV